VVSIFVPPPVFAEVQAIFDPPVIPHMPCSFTPTGKWMVAQAHACIEQAREAGLDMSSLIHERDEMYIREFDQVLKDSKCRVIKTAPQPPIKMPSSKDG
jgi:hypothetical protein